MDTFTLSAPSQYSLFRREFFLAGSFSGGLAHKKSGNVLSLVWRPELVYTTVDRQTDKG